MEIPFGITFKWKGGKHENYKYVEVSNFIELLDDLDEPLQTQYRQFLNHWLDGKIKKSTPVDVEVLKTFHGDLDNRCQIDFREDHWEDDEDITAGGKHFGDVAIKLANHLEANDIEVKWL
jgi:hypothetical protein